MCKVCSSMYVHVSENVLKQQKFKEFPKYQTIIIRNYPSMVLCICKKAIYKCFRVRKYRLRR